MEYRLTFYHPGLYDGVEFKQSSDKLAIEEAEKLLQYLNIVISPSVQKITLFKFEKGKGTGVGIAEWTREFRRAAS